MIEKAKKLVELVAQWDVTWLRALSFGVAAGVEHVPVLHQLECRTAVDIGANRGQFALALRHCFPECTVVSFEPLNVPAALFRRVFTNDGRTTLHETAIGPEVGDTLIHVSGLDDSSSLLPITPAQNRLFPGTLEVATATVRVSPLSEFLSAQQIIPPAILKLDVQGYELPALLGCENLLTCFSWIYVECSFVELYEGQALADEVIAWLRDHGFALHGIYNPDYDWNGSAVQADFLFKANMDATK